MLLALPVDDTSTLPRQPIALEGEPLTRSCVLLDGFACRYKLSPDGSRQIVSFHMPGDLIDLHSALLKVADHSIAAIGRAHVAYLPHAVIFETTRRYAGIAHAFWLETVIDGSIFREWLLNVGRRDAYGRLAHLFCELALRLDSVGLCPNGRCQFPVTQTDLADATGLTPVHVNRTMQRLRADKLISTHGTELRILDWKGLIEAGSFDPTYLYLPNGDARC